MRHAPSRRDAVDAAAAATAAGALTALIEATAASGSLHLVSQPLYGLTLGLAAVAVALAARRLRPLRPLHGVLLVAGTFALQLALLLAWGAGVTWVFVLRG